MAASSTFFLTLSLLAMFWVILQSHHGEAFGTFGFNFHHRYSDPVTTILDLQGLPEKGSVEYYSSWVSRDKHRLNNSRRLAESGGNSSLLTFEAGNETARLVNLGYLHYANVTVGTPPLSFIVALDTGSDLFWLPCDCNNSCVQGLLIGRERQIDFNTYSPNASSTSHIVQCNDTMCGQKSQCSVERNACGYKVAYLSSETSSSGILVNDVLHLATDNTKQKSIKAPITFGCGIRQTGAFLDSAAPNGLFGLGTDDTSVPSILAANGLAPKSFSMCFGKEGLGRIVFGDKGGSNLSETPLNLDHSHPTYIISLTQIAVERNVTNVDFTAIFDSGTSFTLLRDPAYTIITENFNSKAKEPRHNFTSDSGIPFEYCYDLSPNQTYVDVPRVYLTMKGGDQFEVFKPVELLCNETCIYCLAIVTNGSINIIGQNFMTGQRVIFDSEKLVLGWEPSADCNDVGSKQSNTTTTLPVNKQRPAAEAPSPTTIVPEATSGNGGAVPTTPHSGNNASHLKSSFFSTLTLLSSLFLSFS